MTLTAEIAPADSIPSSQPQPAPEPSPTIGGEVIVSYIDGNHTVRTVVAHVLAITPASTAGEQPSLSLAFPHQPIDVLKLSSARWSDAYERRTGVVHHTHPDAVSGKAPIAWGHALGGGNFLPALIKSPEGDGKNPIFERHILEDRPVRPDVAQVSAVQHGKAPEGVSAPALTSEVGSPAPVQLGEGIAEPKPPADPTSEPKPPTEVDPAK
jgi:hypothetical protein